MEALIPAPALRAGLAVEYDRLRAVVEATPPETPVPTCPEWSVADLVRHVRDVYRDKVATMRASAPQAWPPPDEPGPPVESLDRAYAALCAELDGRPLAEVTHSWYPPDQTVGFWLRRMTHETIIHRLDAALAAAAPLPAVGTPLAIDGIDEVLHCFLAFGTREYASEFGPTLAGADGRTVLVQTAGRGWAVTLTPDAVRVGAADADTNAAASVTGEPFDVLRWLWRRGGGPTLGGDPALTERLAALLATATQ